MMGRLILSTFMTVDGVMEAPGFEEHRSGRNAWALRLGDAEMQRFKREELRSVEALLMGRITYQIWAAFWPSLADEESFGRRMNELPKFVVSRTLKDADWAGTTILRGDLDAEVANLKSQFAGDILLQGSADLVAGLLPLGLIDEIRLMIFPVVLGSGKRLFADEAELGHLRLVETRTFPSGVVLLTYGPEAEARSGKFADAYAWTPEQVESLHAAQDTDRVLATVMFTDIVDSTARAAELGDRPWRQLLDRHDEITRAQVERWHGQLVKSTGDGVLATFDAPTRALRCAFLSACHAGRGRPRYPCRDPHGRGGAPRERRRRHRDPHRGSRAHRRRPSRCRRHADRPRAGDGRRPRVRAARRRWTARRARAVGAVRSLDRRADLTGDDRRVVSLPAPAQSRRRRRPGRPGRAAGSRESSRR